MFYIPLHGTGHTVGHVPPMDLQLGAVTYFPLFLARMESSPAPPISLTQAALTTWARNPWRAPS